MKRRFRGLRRPPAERYDVVIVGAGIGGLLTGCLLARGGLRVLLVEEHYMAGGYCSTFRRAGFTFDAGSHFYPMLGNPETRLGRLLLELGVEVDWIPMDPVDVFHFPDGSRFAVSADFDTYRRDLATEFPHQAEALDAFFADAHKLYLHGVLAYFRGRETPRFLEWRERTLWQELERRFDDPKLRLLLTADCPHWGSPPERISFVFDSMLRMTYFLGNYYPCGSSQVFADELARVFESLGGELLMSTRAARIETTHADGAERVAAVELETLRGKLRGRYRVEAERMVSNVDWGVTFEQLLADSPAAASWNTHADGLRPSHPCYLVHLGVDGVPRERLEEIQGYWWDSWDVNRMARGALRCKVFVPTLYDPELAPAASEPSAERPQVVILQKVWAVDYDAVDDWGAHKAEIEEIGVSHLESLLPGVRERIVTAQTASARTSWHFTRNHHGAMLGWEMSPDQLGARRPSPEGPVEGLTLVGHWTRPGGGIVPVLESAAEAADRILGASPTDTRRIEESRNEPWKVA
ncbi:MAG: NAD(P)/FAD-dependent oxidoreductase [Acidobacteriota bacterium]